MAKIPELVKIREEKGLKFDIQIDGGVGMGNLREVLATGVDIVVAGSAVFGAENPAEAAKSFLEVFKEFE